MQLPDDAGKPFQIHQAAPLGDLQAEILGREAGDFQIPPDHFHEIVLLELAVGQIDIQCEIRILPKQGLGILHGPSQNPLTQQHEGGVVFDDGNESVRRNHAVFRGAPPQQCLRAGELVAARGHDGLVIELEAFEAILNGHADGVQQHHQIAPFLVNFVLEDLEFAVFLHL